MKQKDKRFVVRQTGAVSHSSVTISCWTLASKLLSLFPIRGTGPSRCQIYLTAQLTYGEAEVFVIRQQGANFEKSVATIYVGQWQFFLYFRNLLESALQFVNLKGWFHVPTLVVHLEAKEESLLFIKDECRRPIKKV